MKVDAGTVTILRISEVPRLDPIRVTLDDIEPGKGRINIECYGKAWASYWGAMGDHTIARFFESCDNGYLINNLSPGLYKTHFSADALQTLCRKTIRIRRKRTREALANYDALTRAEAEELMDMVSGMRCESESECWSKSAVLERIFGPDGVLVAVQATEPNPDYLYLSRICDVVREALKTHCAAAQKGTND